MPSMPVILALWEAEAEAGGFLEFKVSLVYRVTSRTARTIQRNPVPKKPNPKKPKYYWLAWEGLACHGWGHPWAGVPGFHRNQ